MEGEACLLEDALEWVRRAGNGLIHLAVDLKWKNLDVCCVGVLEDGLVELDILQVELVLRGHHAHVIEHHHALLVPTGRDS